MESRKIAPVSPPFTANELELAKQFKARPMPTFAKASPKPNISSAKSPAVGSHNACHTSKPTVITILCQPRLATAARREWRQTETGAFEAREVFNMEETHCEVVGKQGRKSEGRAPSSVASRSSNAVPRSGPTVLFWNLSLGGNLSRAITRTASTRGASTHRIGLVF